jgi:ABC-type dipeptide/oligopeptide/nickel transport systems, permease components
MKKIVAVGGDQRVIKSGILPRNAFFQSLRVLVKDKIALLGMIIILLVIISAIFAPIISPYNPNVGNGAMRLSPVGTPGHILGLDSQGRDILSRLIWGGRLSLYPAIVPIILMAILSLFLGLIAGYYGGTLGETIMRVLDVLFAFPVVLIAVAIAAIAGAGIFTIMFSISISLLPYMTRVVYTSTLTEKTKEYVIASRTLGESELSIIFREITPNVLSDLVVYSTTLVGGQICFAAGLSFLGLGIQPPSSDWGLMTADGMNVLTEGAPHVATIPGLTILIVATAFNWLGDGLRDVLDPYKRTR